MGICMEQYVITISRQFGSMGRSIAKELSENLGIEFLDRDIVEAHIFPQAVSARDGNVQPER